MHLNVHEKTLSGSVTLHKQFRKVETVVLTLS